jgi:ABC-2 type transport system permease protein
MKNAARVFSAEFLKLRRSKILWITLAAMVFMALMGGFMMFVSMNPDFAMKAGLIGEKAKLMGSPDWPAFFGFLSQMVMAGGAILYGIAASWLFGREYSDKTVKDLLARPVSRSSVVAAKYLVALVWFLMLAAAAAAAGVASGLLIGLPGWSWAAVSQGLRTILVSAAFEMLLAAPVAFLASAGKGYLLPIGFVIFTLILGNLMEIIGFAPYFPWSVPAVYTQDPAGVGAVSCIIVAATSIAGMSATFAWWRYADQK